VRELRNVVERALVFARREQIQPHHLPPELLQSRDQANDTPEEVVNTNSIPLSLSELERRHIEKTLVWAEGNKVKTAEALGISRSTLYEKMKQYEINL
ncbi:MAG TPA: helix-turn-helix domain-containing protein, partial [Candidatus Hydrogenedentes bacterium]|nr:helix-turn-helix domain-containing protein [Candidatus Hydrogenedentota bacterium]